MQRDDRDLTQLLLVVDNDGIPAVDEQKARSKRRKRRYGQVSIDWLADPAWREAMAPWLRLYLLLQYLTKRGEQSVRLTNEMAAEAGLDRHQKSRCLHELVTRGLVTGWRYGQHNPVVSLVLPTNAVTPE
jgi:hypothetical protein